MAKKKAVARQSSGWLALAIVSITLKAPGGAAVTVLSEVIKAIIDHVGDKELEDKITSGFADIDNQLRDLRIQIGRIPLREYDKHMAAGRRHLQDVMDTQEYFDRRQTIQNAKAKFIVASAVAEVKGDLERRLLAEVAIAGCWYALESQEGLYKTLKATREAAETGVLDGDRAIIVRYSHILRLCRNLGIVPVHWAEPLDPQLMPGIKATIPMVAVVGTSAYLLGVQVLVTATSPGVVSFEVWNERWPEVQVGGGQQHGRLPTRPHPPTDLGEHRCLVQWPGPVRCQLALPEQVCELMAPAGLCAGPLGRCNPAAALEKMIFRSAIDHDQHQRDGPEQASAARPGWDGVCAPAARMRARAQPAQSAWTRLRPDGIGRVPGSMPPRAGPI
ncbi:hypothetical protein [Amycolatopsis sp. WQ 127309]|uniref:hypothetical protein n=1 Tax=Amycolatopsis sp. WQ 127309 TaxID=2932773 RepID=UPI001FF5ADAF|nr:hypothetical protein [Amycolatopsis sp. WQ 127309]UOZ03307.1 hypothetical protein MUY22_31170 [Amycolatopsis sp. WQ 127309]